MDRPRSRQRANSVGAHQSEHKHARTSQVLEQTKEPSQLAPVDFFGLRNQPSHRSNAKTLQRCQRPARRSNLQDLTKTFCDSLRTGALQKLRLAAAPP